MEGGGRCQEQLGGDTWGQGLLQASLRMNQDREAVKGEIADALA